MDFSAPLPEKKKKELAPRGPYPLLDLEKAKEHFKPYIEKIDGILKQAQGLKVETDEANQIAVELGTSAKILTKQIEETRNRAISEPYSFVKSVNGFAKIFTDKLLTIESLMKQKISTYRVFQEQRRREAQLAADKATEELKKKLNKQAEKTGTAPVQVEMPIIPKQEAVTRSETGSAYGSKHWTFKIVDADLIPKEYLLASKEQGKAEGDRLFAEQKALIRNAIKGGMRKINGIEIFEEDRTSFRT